MSNKFFRRANELREWCAETGRELPMPAEAIMLLEDHGWVVDLESGRVAGPNWPIALMADVWLRATLAGQAVAGEGGGL